MTIYMNDFDIENAKRAAFRDDKPVLAGAAHTLDALREWVDFHSDGWAHWQVPRRSARLLMELVDAAARPDAPDIDPARLKRAYSTLRMFATRHNRGAYGRPAAQLHFDDLITTFERAA